MKDDSFLNRKLLRSGVSVYSLLWLSLLLAAVLLRFTGLGERAMSHDESQHALFSFYFFRDGGYIHDPITHGPLLFHLNALAYQLFGLADWSARVFPSMAGVLLVAAIYPLRRYIGQLGALAAALMVVFSPALLAYSRYLRNDIYICLFTLIWVFSAFRYLETRAKSWLYLLAAVMGLAFVTKETSFIFGLIIGGFFLSVFLSEIGRAKKTKTAATAGTLAVLLSTIILPFAAPLIHLLAGWPVTDYSNPSAFWRALLSSGLLAFLAFLVVVAINNSEWARNRLTTLSTREWFSIAAVFWTVQALFFTSLFTNIRGGLTSGVVGSLGYWLTQHEVGRGGQPWFYYGVLTVLYEFLPLVLAGTGFVYILAERLREARVRENGSPTKTEKETAARIQYIFVLFLCWWVVSSWLLYSMAGERMPWLLTQISLPMIMLGGWFLGKLAQQLKASDWKRFLMVALSAPILMIALIRLLTSAPSLEKTVSSVTETTNFVGALLVACLIVGFLVKVLRASEFKLWRPAYFGIVALLFFCTIRISYVVNFRDSESARHLLVYAHATPDIKTTLREIKALSSLAGQPEAKVVNDAQTQWPFGWYLEREGRSLYVGDSVNPDEMTAPFALLNSESAGVAGPLASRGYSKIVRRLIWWPVEFYQQLGPSEVLRDLLSLDSRKRALQYFLNGDRNSMEHQPSVKEFQFYYRSDLLSPNPSGQVLNTRTFDSLSGPFDGTPLEGPQDISVGPLGIRAIADTGNHRVIILTEKAGILVVGGPCSLARQDGRDCIDPDGDGPLELGDGQFDSPMGVTVGPKGEVFVADTRNGRIQVFNSEGRFLRKWGKFGSTGGQLGDPYTLYGPRDVALDLEGNLLVSDTGNKRILRYSPSGEFLGQFGGYGQMPSQLDEPVGIAVAGAGTIFVADTWNRRIQLFESNGVFSESRLVPGWQTGTGPFRPYLAFDRSSNLLYASDPENQRLLVSGLDGQTQAEALLVIDSDALPVATTGIAIDERTRQLFLCDCENNRILVAELP